MSTARANAIGRPPGLADRAEIGRAADQAGDPGLLDRPAATAAGLAGAAVHGVDGEEAAFQAQDGAIAGVEARALGGDRQVEDLADGPVQPVELVGASA